MHTPGRSQHRGRSLVIPTRRTQMFTVIVQIALFAVFAVSVALLAADALDDSYKEERP